MKKIIAFLLLLCLALTALPALAANEYYGNMEVVNCKEWVSLRLEPSTTSSRVKKVPLGAFVEECQQMGKGWIYAVYDGEQGYIQDQYLKICEGEDIYSAMLVTNCEESMDVYEAVGDLQPAGVIPADTVVRNCAVLARGRVYVEYGCQSGYVDDFGVVPYNELQHFPRQVTLRCAPPSIPYDGPVPVLRIADQAGFTLGEEACIEYDYTEYVPVDADTPKAEFILYADTALQHVHLFSASLRYVNAETGEEVYDFELEHIQYQLEAGQPLAVTAVIYGDTPNLAVGYEDWTGAYHFAFVEISGEDGSFLLREF